MIKRNRIRGRYSCKLHERAVRAETKVKAICDAAERCMRHRDSENTQLRNMLRTLLKSLAVITRQTEGKAFNLPLADIEAEDEANLIVMPDTKLLKLVYVEAKAAEAETEEEPDPEAAAAKDAETDNA